MQIDKLDKQVRNLELTVDKKAKEASNSKDSFKKELQSYKDQLANLQKSLDAEKATNEKLKKKHEDALV